MPTKTEVEILKYGAEARRELARRNFLDFVLYTFPAYNAGWFHRHVAHKLQKFWLDVKTKKSPRLMLFAPPRHGKSELVSRRFPAWLYGQDPNLNIIAASYSAGLAGNMNRDVRRIMKEDEYKELFPRIGFETENTEQFRLTNTDLNDESKYRGFYRSAGVGVGITGMGADIFVIDDPVKDAQEAQSLVLRDSTWHWYSSTGYSRLEPGGGILLIMTRWNEDDVAGRLLEQMRTGDGDDWEVIRYPAISIEDERDENGKLLRRKDRPLHRARFSLDRLKKIKIAVGSLVWNALYQQDPRPGEGGLFQKDWLPIVDIAPHDQIMVARYWDRAGTQDGGDWSVGCKMARLSDGRYIVLDVDRFQKSPGGVQKRIKAIASQDGIGCTIGLEQDPAQAGKVDVDFLIKFLAGYITKAYPVMQNKAVRAGPISAQCEAGNVVLLRGAWNDSFIKEVCSFPNGKWDDQVDGFSGAFLMVASNLLNYAELAKW